MDGEPVRNEYLISSQWSGTAPGSIFYTGGNVGIGTQTANAPLNVWGPGTIASSILNPQPGQLIINTTTGSERLILGTWYTGGVGSYCTIQSSDYYSSLDHGQTLALNPLGGNIGIGTTSPGYTLDVGSFGVDGGTIRIVSSSSCAFRMMEVNDAYGFSFTNVAASRMSIKRHSASQAGSEIISILRDNPYVGISKTNPVYTLDVNGYIRCNARDQGFLLGLDGAMWDNSRWWMDGGATYLDFGGMENGFKIRGNNDNTNAFGSQTYTEYMKVTARTGAIAGGTSGGGGFAFAHPGIALDRTWLDYPCITVFNTAGTGSTNQTQLRVHGTNATYASYPDAGGADFSVNMQIDGSAYNVSDQRSKINVSSITNALDLVAKMDGKRFQRINSVGEVQTHISQNSYKYGFIAQDLQAQGIDEIYVYSPEEDDGTNGYNTSYAVDYASVTAILVNAVKELQAKVVELEAKLCLK
jgi:hypothetical protein